MNIDTSLEFFPLLFLWLVMLFLIYFLVLIA